MVCVANAEVAGRTSKFFADARLAPRRVSACLERRRASIQARAAGAPHRQVESEDMKNFVAAAAALAMAQARALPPTSRVLRETAPGKARARSPQPTSSPAGQRRKRKRHMVALKLARPR
jgi:hypothetical protein